MGEASSTAVRWRDDQSWRHALDGAPRAWAQLVRPHGATVYGALAFLFGDGSTARASFKAAIVHGFERLRERPDDLPLPAWLVALGREAGGAVRGGDVLERLEASLAHWPRSAAQAMRMIAALPPRARAAAYLRWAGGLRVDAIATAIDEPAELVSTSLFHAVNCLHRRRRLAGSRATGGAAHVLTFGPECRTARAAFFLYRDGALSPRRQARVREHFATCQACLDAEARLQQNAAEIAGTLASLRWPGLDLGLHAAFHALRPWGLWRRLYHRTRDALA